MFWPSRTVDQFQNHLEKSFLQKLPSEYSSLLREGGFDDEAGGSINMSRVSSSYFYLSSLFFFIPVMHCSVISVPEAPLDSFVFCITRESVEDLQLDERLAISLFILLLYFILIINGNIIPLNFWNEVERKQSVGMQMSFSFLSTAR